MNTHACASDIISSFDRNDVKMGDLKKAAKAIKMDHDLGMELWASGKYHPRMLATLIFDKAQLDQETIDTLATDMASHDADERDRLSEWLLANQLTKSKATQNLLENWQGHDSPILRRLFWYHQARQRWTGQTPPDNTPALLDALDNNLINEDQQVQWAMNFCAGWIGVFQPEHRARCVKLGEKSGLYKDEVVPRNCTPGYLPEFIRIEVEKRA